MTYRSNMIAPTYSAVKAAIGEAFKCLRKDGVIARQAFCCCRSCAGAALDTEKNRGKPAVFFTRQDQESLERTGQVYIGFGHIGVDIDNTGVARDMVKALEAQGLLVEWDGSERSRVLVKGMKPAEPEATFLDLVWEL